ncbi:hypothetical protein [Idiomarina aminovorans]|uniref:hypothetical protein n=1 Tax=Idiomarina aminovorans TaxID=2914829 RepID=UPI002002E863|nr:hypothetical protein [Idiomarina sp. ATCH4]MCK7460202.1 hypothetical protein [Idiomarina sp. ATCH4]
MAQVKSELTDVQFKGVTLGIDCLIENEASSENLPIVVVGYEDRDREQALNFLIKFFREAYPNAPKQSSFIEPLMTAGTCEKDALLSLINSMRSRGRLLFYWADSTNWFKLLPSGLFHVIQIERNSARRGKNEQGEKLFESIDKTYSDAGDDLSREIFGLINFDSENSLNGDFNAHYLLYEEASSKIIRPIPAPLTLHFDEIITINSPLWQKQACVALRRYQAKECNDGFHWDESDEGWQNTVIHPVLDEIRLCDGKGVRECLIGQVTMELSPDETYYLSTVWLHPFYRRRGKLRNLWPELKEKYGDFEVEQPNDNMSAFLASIS